MSNTSSPPCQCCGSTSASILHEDITSIYAATPYSLLRCNRCSHVFTDPIPSSDTLAKLYEATYLYPVHLAVQPEKIYRAKQLAQRIIANSPPNPRILEIGCMHGFLLEQLRARGASVKGLEISASAVELCRSKELDVDASSIENIQPESLGRFDAIVLVHVLEHVLDVPQTLQMLRSMLNPNGQLVLAVPNHRSFTARLFRRYWGWWQVPIHINHFNKQSLGTLLRNNGFRVSSQYTRGGDSLLLLLNIMNLLRGRSKPDRVSTTSSKPAGRLTLSYLQLHCQLLKFNYHFTNEELVVTAQVHPTLSA